MTDVLLHVCCGPCSIYPLSSLREQGYTVTAHFYNPNIHPFREFRKRFETLKNYLQEISVPLLAEEEYGLTGFIRKIAFNEQTKCTLCYTMRLEHVVKTATSHGFQSFTTTLLYSKYQRHKILVKICEDFAKQYGISFLYQDFREGWQDGIDKSIEYQMYRQPYCGCIYSEQERYDKSHK